MSTPPLKPVREEFDELLQSCQQLKDLSQLETLISQGLLRVGRSLMQENVQRLADQEPRELPEPFPPQKPRRR